MRNTKDSDGVNAGVDVPAILVPKPRVAYHGEAKLGEGVEVECAVLEDGRRGFLQRQMVRALGFSGGDHGARFDAFCGRIGLNHLIRNENPDSPVLEVTFPGHGNAYWTPWEVLPAVIKATMKAAASRKLTRQQTHIAERCSDLADALIGVGLVALIDEATGYQHHRAPDALQDLFSRLIRKSAADWELRFHPEYYEAVCKLFGFAYGKTHRPLPSIVGKITMDQVYMVIFPTEIIAEIKARQKSEKIHQWLTKEGGLKLLEKQRDAVMMIARSSVDYKDFEARCSVAFYKPGRQMSMILPAA